jgi:protein subunit release factor A
MTTAMEVLVGPRGAQAALRARAGCLWRSSCRGGQRVEATASAVLTAVATHGANSGRQKGAGGHNEK